MAKFSKEYFDTEKNNGFRAGSGLLSSASKKEVKMKIDHIPRNQIDKNENNAYSINDIESLAWSIRQAGLLQPIHLVQTNDGRYKILGGERRITAIDSLIADPKVPDWTEDSLIPAVIRDPQDIDLPIDGKLKEAFAILTSNKESRKYTDADRLMEIRNWKKIISALRDAGVESIPVISEDGSETTIKIKGQKTRDILSQTTGLSRGTINTFEKVENQGTEEIIDALLHNDITVKTAAKKVDEESRNTPTAKKRKEKRHIERGDFSGRSVIIEWIPVTDRLPDNEKIKLVTVKTQKGLVNWNRAYFDGRHWHGSGSMSGVIAWADMEPWDES